MSHLFPTSSTCALSHEYVLIWVDLRERELQHQGRGGAPQGAPSGHQAQASRDSRHPPPCPARRSPPGTARAAGRLQAGWEPSRECAWRGEERTPGHPLPGDSLQGRPDTGGLRQRFGRCQATAQVAEGQVSKRRQQDTRLPKPGSAMDLPSPQQRPQLGAPMVRPGFGLSAEAAASGVCEHTHGGNTPALAGGRWWRRAGAGCSRPCPPPACTRSAHQSCTALKDSSLVMSYIRMKPMAPR